MGQFGVGVSSVAGRTETSLLPELLIRRGAVY